MLLEEFDVEKYERTIKKEGYEEGHAEGRASGLREGRAEGHASGLQEGRASDVLTILEQWLLTAVSAEDIEAFREKIGIS